MNISRFLFGESGIFYYEKRRIMNENLFKKLTLNRHEVLLSDLCTILILCAWLDRFIWSWLFMGDADAYENTTEVT